MIKNIIFSLIFFITAHAAVAQDFLQPKLIKKIDGSFSYYKRDESGNVFAITTVGQLKKYNANLDSMGVFNDIRSFGSVDYVTSNNSLRTLLFSKQFRSILILDRLMQVVNKINLNKLQVFQVQAVTQSYDNNIWVFDEQESKLKKISESGKLIFESADLRLALSDVIQPVSIFDQNGFVYLYDALKGLFIFDYYGALKNKIALIGWTNVQFVGNVFLGTKGNNLLIYTPGSLNTKEMKIPEELVHAKSLQYSSQGCMALFEDGIYSFHWNK
jgi:hypothetical protein